MNEDKIVYWCIRKYQYDDNIIEDESTDDWYNLNGTPRKLLVEDTFIASDRNEAKLIVLEKYGKHPFSLTKKNKVNGHIYYRLQESSQYWYDKIYKEIDCICYTCEKEFKMVGTGNVITGYDYESKDVKDFCSYDCKNIHRDLEKEQGLGVWVDKSSHIDEDVVGYIYRITNKHSNRCYIGQSVDVPIFRWWSHLTVSDVKEKFEINSVVDLIFEVVYIVYTNDENSLSYYEQYYIDRFDSYVNGYNKRNEIK